MAPIEPLIPAELAPAAAHHHRISTSSRDSGSEPGRPSLSQSIESHTRGRSSRSSSAGATSSSLRARFGLLGVARRTLGISLLLLTVFLWTLSNFLASALFSDGTYSKPFFLVYVNTSMFAISLIPMVAMHVYKNGVSSLKTKAVELWREKRQGASPLRDEDDEDNVAGERLLGDDEGAPETTDGPSSSSHRGEDKLTMRETAWLSLEFCMLWFLANYFASACLEYTSVGSVTILTSTSSIWTLIFCAVTGVEGFTMRKLIGVLASLTGVVLISAIDLSGASDDNRGKFTHKTPTQIAIGDSMAFISAIIYGVYVTVMKRRVGNEDRVNMPLFFGLVGLFNVMLLWPIFFVLHFTGIEKFELPPTGTVWVFIMINSVASFFSDMTWAYAMLLTTPLVVTVGLSLTIPLSLIGEMIQYEQYSSWVYWVGAGIVFISFLFVNNESHEEGEGDAGQRAEIGGNENDISLA
ncbi:hypothetical protein B0T19DRAFT_423130 [Cercophora scortea]|uniref:DUF3955 domain-containing protein n=1 Tax=Cercophora scortea TaxID=314031 RepID=A0AAE0IN17_9PEZI|nr:hypothetical protein B0T19DRAFT_423130 [Cercophora scortea]